MKKIQAKRLMSESGPKLCADVLKIIGEDRNMAKFEKLVDELQDLGVFDDYNDACRFFINLSPLLNVTDVAKRIVGTDSIDRILRCMNEADNSAVLNFYTGSFDGAECLLFKKIAICDRVYDKLQLQNEGGEAYYRDWIRGKAGHNTFYLKDFNIETIMRSGQLIDSIDGFPAKVRDSDLFSDTESRYIVDYSWGYPQFIAEKSFEELPDDLKEYLLGEKFSVCLDDLVLDYKLKNTDYDKWKRLTSDDLPDFVEKQSKWAMCDNDPDDVNGLFDTAEEKQRFIVEFDGTVRDWLLLKKQLTNDRSLLVLCDDGTVMPARINHRRGSESHSLYYLSPKRYFPKYADSPDCYIAYKSFFGLLYYIQKCMILTEGRCPVSFSACDQARNVPEYDILDYHNFASLVGSVDLPYSVHKSR